MSTDQIVTNFTRQDPPWFAWFVSTRGSSAAAAQRSHYAHPLAHTKAPKQTGHSGHQGAEEPETALRELSIHIRKDQELPARAEPRYFLLTIVFGHRPTENLLPGAGTRISLLHHSCSSSLILTE